VAADPVPGQHLGGRYALREQVGRGGFGVVWRAHDTLLQRDVAVKAIEFPAILDDAERAVIRTKVLREARAAARLNHPGLITVFDVIEEEGRPLIVMELVRASTLADLVTREGPLPEDRVAAIGIDVLEALGAAHSQGIVHRDVKPANVMVSESGHVQLGDFGIAAVIDDPKLTSSGNLAGSPSYMAPEQAQNRPPTAATDLWGLGATLYFAVEGTPPFAGTGAIATLTAVVNSPHRPLRRATLLKPLLGDLLAKDPDARPTAAATRRRLSDVLAGTKATGHSSDITATAELDPSRDWDASPGAPGDAGDERRVPVEAVVDPDAAPTDAEPIFGQSSSGGPAGTARPDRSPPIGPDRASAPRGRLGPDRSRRRAIVPVVVGVMALAVVVVVGLLVAGRDAKSPTTAAPGSVATNANPTTTVASSSGAPASVPKDWVAYRDPVTGFAIAHPPDWTVSTSGTRTDIRSPSSGAYLRVDHREPPGPSPEGAWRDLEPSFAGQNANYKRVQITPTTYDGYRAAVWEYTYSGGGAALRAVDLGFIAGNHGFALNFQTPASDWDRLQPVFAAFKASFKAPTS